MTDFLGRGLISNPRSDPGLGSLGKGTLKGDVLKTNSDC